MKTAAAPAKGMKEGSKAEEAMDMKQAEPADSTSAPKKMPYPMQGLRVTQRTPGRNKSSVI